MYDFAWILRYLPKRILPFLEDYRKQYPFLQEIRLRENRPISLTVDGRNIVVTDEEYHPVVCEKEEISICVSLLCENSLHSHSETIKNGYISLIGGHRIGVSGRAILDQNQICNVTDITSLNIRIPHPIDHVSDPLVRYLQKNEYRKGILIYSLPGIGKTTLLRDLAIQLASGRDAKRVVLIDTRNEILQSDRMELALLDILSGYPKAKGIEIATRTLSPELLFCDEIGSYEEAEAILSVQNTGVPLLATAHASSLTELLRRKNIAILHENHVFDCYAGIRRKENARQYTFTMTEWENV